MAKGLSIKLYFFQNALSKDEKLLSMFNKHSAELEGNWEASQQNLSSEERF